MWKDQLTDRQEESARLECGWVGELSCEHSVKVGDWEVVFHMTKEWKTGEGADVYSGRKRLITHFEDCVNSSQRLKDGHKGPECHIHDMV